MSIVEEEYEQKTIEDLIEFLNTELRSGHSRPSTILPLRIAVKKIMVETSDDLEDWREVEIKNLDLSQRMQRFKERMRDNCSEQTMHVYYMRFLRALRLFKNEYERQNNNVREELTSSSMKSPTILQGAKSEERFTSTTNEILSIFRTMISDYTLSSRETIIKRLREERFEYNNVIYPVFLESNKEAFIILPKNLSKKDKEKMRCRLDSMLELHSRKGGIM